eukprot:jgi/Chlat1/5934/Chrsp4S06410
MWLVNANKRKGTHASAASTLTGTTQRAVKGMPEEQVHEHSPLHAEPPNKKQRVLVRHQHEQHEAGRLDADSMHGGSEQLEQQSSELHSRSWRAAKAKELVKFVSNIPKYVCIQHKKTKAEGWMSRDYLYSKPRKKGIRSFYSRDPVKVPDRQDNAPMSSTNWLVQAGDREKSNSGHAIMVRVGNNLFQLVDVVEAVDIHRARTSPIVDAAEANCVHDEQAAEAPLPSATNQVPDSVHETPAGAPVSASDDQPAQHTASGEGEGELQAVLDAFSSARSLVNNELARVEGQLRRLENCNKEVHELNARLADADRQLNEARSQLMIRELQFKDRDDRLQEMEQRVLAQQQRADALEKQLQEASEFRKRLAQMASILQTGS